MTAAANTQAVLIFDNSALPDGYKYLAVAQVDTGNTRFNLISFRQEQNQAVMAAFNSGGTATTTFTLAVLLVKE